MKPVSIISIFCFILLSCCLIGCSKQETFADQAIKEKLLLVGNGAEPTSLDPAFAMTTKDENIMHAVFESLLILDPETLRPRPGVAMDWNVSPNGLTYTFYLRHDARFSNGDPVTAKDFIFSLKRILSPHLNSQNAILLYDIQNAKEYNEGKITDFNQVSIRALDDYILQFQLNHPNPFFTSIVASWFFIPLHEKTLEKFNAIETANDTWLQPGNLVGNGPFVMKEWQPNNYIEVEKNPYYWDFNTVKLNKIRFYVIRKEIAENGRQVGISEEEAFRKGLLHVADNLTPREAAQFLHSYFKEDYHLRSVDVSGVYAYLFNTEVWPLNDVRVRKALSIALDRSEIINNIVNQVFNDDRKPAYNIIPSVIKGYYPTAQIHEDFQAARKLLTEAGFPYGEGFPHLTLLFDSEKFHRNIAEAVKDMWWRYLNIKVNFDVVDWKTVIHRLQNKDYQIVRLTLLASFRDPLDILQNFTKDSTRMPTGWYNPQFDRLLDDARKAPDVPTRFKLFAEAEAILLDEAPIIPIAFPRHNIMVNPAVRGWQNNSAMINYYQFIDLVPVETNK